jgi:ribosomal protein L11 methyltransferase
MPPVQYWRLTFPRFEESSGFEEPSEGLVNFIWELGALGVVEDEELQAFFPPGTSPGELLGQIRAYLDGLRQLGFRAPPEPTLAPLLEEPWAEAWKRYFAPVAVGRGLLIVPGWVAAESGAELGNGGVSLPAPVPPDQDTPRTRIVIEPGRAFGTGHHGSTAGCLVLLERVLARAPAGRAVDLGTGSGILAITAAHLGVAEVLAIDVDPDAVANAAANARRNGVAQRVRCTLGDAATTRLPEPVSLALANLLAPAHIRLASRYSLLLRPGGTLIAGGILDSEVPATREALAAARLTAVDEASVDGWSALACARS